MKRPFASVIRLVIFWGFYVASSIAGAEQRELPAPLAPWREWVTWHDRQVDCPSAFYKEQERICFWPSRLELAADQDRGSWKIDAVVFAETWVPLPGGDETWPLNVRAGDDLVAVVQRKGVPTVKLTAGSHRLSGDFQWQEMPQRIAIPKQIGIVSLTIDGDVVPIPKWDSDGFVWLKRLRAEAADKDLLAAKVYRVVEGGIPIWLRTEVELTVSGKSREETLGWVLPEGWKLSMVESPLPVAVNEGGVMKAQVRAGKWTIGIHAFRSEDVNKFRFATDAQPITPSELVALKVNPEFRISEFEGIEAVDVTQTTFPDKWRGLPVYEWKTDAGFRLVERMRGMGFQRPAGLAIDRRFWLDEDGKGLTYRDALSGTMQQIWRLDVADDHQLGAVRIDGESQLITANPKSGAHGVEIRSRDVTLEAIGRVEGVKKWPATGWQTDVDSLQLTVTLPPGWRLFALFGADNVEGDWLTAWSLLDLFLLLIFSLAVFRLWGVTAGLVALLAFGLAYHEPGAPRLTWFFLLMPVALLRVVPAGMGKRLLEIWKYFAVALLLLFLVPFVARQVQSAIYPQLEIRNWTYGAREVFGMPRRAYDDFAQLEVISTRAPESVQMPVSEQRAEIVKGLNLKYDSSVQIQTGPAEPKWSWNQVYCYWNGPVTAEQRITPILIPLSLRRSLNVVSVLLLLILAAYLLGVGRPWNLLSKRHVTAAATFFLVLAPWPAFAQFPDQQLLDTLRKRLLEPSDAFPHAAEIPAVDLEVSENRLAMKAEVHAAARAAVPLPGRLPAWSPLTVKIDGEPAPLVCRRDDYVWVTVPAGVHQVAVEGLLPDVTEWEWSFLLKPRRVSIEAPGWNVTGLRRNGVPEPQVFFVRQEKLSEGEVAYDRRNFNAIVVVDRHLEVGLIWKVRNIVTRLSSPGKAISLNVPLLAAERVISSNVVVENGLAEVRLGAGQTSFEWESELPVSSELRLQAEKTGNWVERWHLITSPVWNVKLSGLAPVFESNQTDLIPVWHPWPGEEATLGFSRPKAVSGDTITVQQVRHEISLGSRQRTSSLNLDLECSLGADFIIVLATDADISSLKLDDRTIPVRRDGSNLFVPVRPGRQKVDVAWRTTEKMETVVGAGKVTLPVEGSNVTTVMRVPESRWVLWAEGPRRGPAVRFWTILVVALLAAVLLGSFSLSPLKRIEWLLLALGLTQVHLAAAMLVVGWLFALAWRGKDERQQMPVWRFNLLQIGLVLLTVAALGILVAVVGEGLLGNPKMFILGNGSSQTLLQWFEPRIGQQLPEPFIVSISVWYYRLLMLGWALWLAAVLLRWLKWGWGQFSSGGGWKRRAKIIAARPAQNAKPDNA